MHVVSSVVCVMVVDVVRVVVCCCGRSCCCLLLLLLSFCRSSVVYSLKRKSLISLSSVGFPTNERRLKTRSTAPSKPNFYGSEKTINDIIYFQKAGLKKVKGANNYRRLIT